MITLLITLYLTLFAKRTRQESELFRTSLLDRAGRDLQEVALMNVQTSQVLATVGTIAAVLVCKRLMGQNKPSRAGVDLGNLAGTSFASASQSTVAQLPGSSNMVCCTGIVSFSARIMAGELTKAL